MAKNRTINVQGHEITISQVNQEDYICITDMAKTRKGDSRAIDIIKNWLRNRNTIEFLGGWETLYNPDFKVEIFDHFRKQAGLNSFVLNPQVWVEETGAKGIISKSGRYGGTFAHKDIAFEFGTWLSPSFKLYLIVLSNLESLNAMLIREKVAKKKRFELLRKTAVSQLGSLNKIKTAIPAIFEIPAGRE